LVVTAMVAAATVAVPVLAVALGDEVGVWPVVGWLGAKAVVGASWWVRRRRGPTVRPQWRPLGDVLVARGGTQLSILAATAVVGSAAMLPLTSGRALSSPLNPFVQIGSGTIVARAADTPRAGLRRLGLVLFAAYLVAVAALVAVVAAVPGVGEALVGDTWEEARDLFFPAAFGAAAAAAVSILTTTALALSLRSVVGRSRLGWGVVSLASAPVVVGLLGVAALTWWVLAVSGGVALYLAAVIVRDRGPDEGAAERLSR
jgi:hypothetical protein